LQIIRKRRTQAASYADLPLCEFASPA
jgi:hypothetical protein